MTLQHHVFVISLPRFEKSSYAKYDLVFRINCDIYTPHAGEKGMLLHRYTKEKIAKLIMCKT
jgi:hypothetical protein